MERAECLKKIQIPLCFACRNEAHKKTVTLSALPKGSLSTDIQARPASTLKAGSPYHPATVPKAALSVLLGRITASSFAKSGL
jgi:hypothetical protein